MPNCKFEISINSSILHFVAAQVKLNNELLMAKTGQKQADHLKRAINRMTQVPVLAEAIKKAPDGTEITAVKTNFGDMFEILLKSPGKTKYKTLFAIFPEQMGKREIEDSSRTLAKKIAEVEPQAPGAKNHIAVA